MIPLGSFLNPPHNALPDTVPAPTKMTTTATSPDSKSPHCADTEPSTSLPKPLSPQREQGDLPDVTSLQLIVSDPVTECHGCPVQQAAAAEKAKQGVPQDGCVEEDVGNSHEAAKRAAPTPHYRPAYELADVAHERLGRGTQAPVLNA